MTDSRKEQSPEGGASRRGAVGQPAAAERRQRREGTGCRRGISGFARGKTPGGEPCTRLWGEINPRGWRSRRRRGRVKRRGRMRVGTRNPGSLWSPAVTAKRGGNPTEGRSRLSRAGDGEMSTELWRRREAHERMKPFTKVCGGRCPVKTIVPVGNDEDLMVPGEPMSQRPDAFNTLKSSEPHESQLVWR